MNPIKKWFLIRNVSVLLATSVTGGYVALNSICLDFYKEGFFSIYKDGFPQKLDEKTTDFCQKVCKEIKQDKDLNKISYFPIFGCEVKSLGSLKFGKASIGLPFFFNYKNAEDIDTNQITLFYDQVPDWETENSQNYLKTLTLSEKCKKFLIAREILKADSNYVPFRAFSMFISALFGAGLSEVAIRNKIRTKTFKSIHISLGLLVGFGFGIIHFLILNDLIELLYNDDINKKIVKLKNLELIEGAIDYHQNMLKRNLCIRKMMSKSDADKYFKPNGDFTNKFGNKSIPLIKNLQFFAEYDKEIKI